MDGLEQARGILAPQPRTDVDICISSAGRVVGSSDDHRCEGIGNPTIPRLDRRCVEKAIKFALHSINRDMEGQGEGRDVRNEVPHCTVHWFREGVGPGFRGSLRKR